MKRLEALAIVLVLMCGCSSCEKPESFGLPEFKPPQQEEQTTAQDAGRENLQDDSKPNAVAEPAAVVWESYVIPSGSHYNHLRSFSLFKGDTLRFRFVLDSTAFYSTTDPSNQADWNKLMGFSDCGSFHHTNSIRFVWRYYQGELQIGEYRYTGSKRDFSTLGSVASGDTNLAEIVAAPGRYELRLNDITVKRPRKCKNRSSAYWLYPYFGGDEAAPQDVNIAIQHLKPKPGN